MEYFCCESQAKAWWSKGANPERNAHMIFLWSQSINIHEHDKHSQGLLSIIIYEDIFSLHYAHALPLKR